MYLGVRVKCLILTKFGIPQQIFAEVPNIKFHLNPFSGCLADTYRQSGRRANNMTPFQLKRVIYGDFMSLTKIKHEVF
jgi:hypothetical protein